MKITPLSLVALAVLGLTTAAHAETRCERLENAQYEAPTDDGNRAVKPDSKLLLAAEFNSGFWTGYATDRGCTMLSDGTALITTKRGKKTTCKTKQLNSANTQYFNDLTTAARGTPISVAPYGVCDAALYSIRLREGTAMTAIDAILECGDREVRQDPQAIALRTAFLKTCESTAAYEDARAGADDRTGD